MARRTITHARFHSKPRYWIRVDRQRTRQLSTRFLPPDRIPRHSTHPLGRTKHPDSSRYLRRSMRYHQKEARSRCLRAFELLVSITMVRRSEERRQSTSTRSQSRTLEQGYDPTFRRRPHPRALSRAVRRTIVRRNARSLRSIRRKESCQIISRSNDVSDTFRRTSHRHPPDGLDELSPDHARRRYAYSSTRDSLHHDPLHRRRFD